MKKLFFYSLLSLFFFGCNDKSEKTDVSTGDSTKMASTASTDELVYPYTLDQPYKDWQPGDKQHTITVMNSLKAFAAGDIEGAMAGFGDSIDVRLDYYHGKLSHDSLRNFFTKDRANFSSITIKMGDWESVISKDKKDEYVTLWYKQIMTDKAGKTDSLSVIDDAKMVNGKIVELDEKIQHFPAKK
ncbi:MAG: hypothetical protein ABIW38_10295 [Ferruginibacter sp.]